MDTGCWTLVGGGAVGGAPAQTCFQGSGEDSAGEESASRIEGSTACDTGAGAAPGLWALLLLAAWVLRWT